ncbi:MAG: DUF2490 domain-containing protein [Methylococcaceae bacterium]|nr:DUF2490 domain-containing protein [Methylococcaceae bacterium]
MILKRQTNWIRSVMLLLAIMVSTKVQATDDFQIWIPININAKLTEQLRGFFELQPRIGDNASNLTSMMVRPALGWAINDRATLWVGYLMSADSVTPDSDTYRFENRAFQGFTWKDTANKKQFIWEVRNRLEERFLPRNSDPSIRWRTRFRVEQLIPDRSSWSVIASDEIFVTLNDNSNDAQLQAGAQQNRLYVGVGYRFTSEVQVETGYLYQHVWKNRPTPDQNNNIWVTNLNFSF